MCFHTLWVLTFKYMCLIYLFLSCQNLFFKKSIFIKALWKHFLSVMLLLYAFVLTTEWLCPSLGASVRARLLLCSRFIKIQIWHIWAEHLQKNVSALDFTSLFFHLSFDYLKIDKKKWGESLEVEITFYLANQAKVREQIAFSSS